MFRFSMPPSTLMGMESPDTRRKADDSYRARSAGRSIVRYRSRCPDPRATDGKIPDLKTPAVSFNRALAGRLDLADRFVGAPLRRAPRNRLRGARLRLVQRRGRMAGLSQEKTLNPQLIIAVACGGALGSVTRYLVGIGS